MDFWKKLFKEDNKGKIGGSLSAERLNAACEIFGSDISPQCERRDVKDLASELVDKVLASDDVMGQIAAIASSLEEIAAGIAELKRFQREYETEKAMWQARGSAMFGPDNATRQLAAYGQKTGSETEPDDFVSIANRLAAKSVKRPKNQDFKHGLAQGWYKRSWF